MDVVVTARIPVEVKEQAGAILHELNSTPTQLINAAYQYLLQEKALPRPRAAATRPRHLTPQQVSALRESWGKMAVGGPASEEAWGDFKQQLAEARDERYATSA